MRKNQCFSDKLGKHKASFESKEEAETFLGEALEYSTVYHCGNGGCGKWHTATGGQRSKKADPNSNRQRERRERRNKRKAS